MFVIPTIRLANVQDALPVAEMSRRYIEQGLGWSWTEARVRRAIGDSATNVTVACEGESILGFAIMQYGDDKAHLSLMAVVPAHRRRGLAGILLAWLEKPAVVAGINRLHAEVRIDNPGALAFYERRGFRQVKRVAGYYSGLIDALRLEKRL